MKIRLRVYFLAFCNACLVNIGLAQPALAAPATATDFSTVQWLADPTVLLLNMTATSSLRLPNGLIRTYQNLRPPVVGNFMYSDSADGTGLTSPRGALLATGSPSPVNASVARLANGNYAVVYSVLPDVSGRRVLYSATSTDGINFGQAAALPSSGIDLNGNGSGVPFMDVPDVVAEPDGSLRVYYVAGATSIASEHSSDGGNTWTQDAGFRLSNIGAKGKAQNLYADPAVIVMPDGTRAMFYSYQPLNGASVTSATIRVATSGDGVNFTDAGSDVLAIPGKFTYDPDVYQAADGRWHMLFGIPNGTNVDLWHAVFSGNPAPTQFTPQTGYWWNPAEPGRGFNIEKNGNNLFMASFLYDTLGNPTWYGVGPGAMNGNTYTGTLTSYANGQTLTGAFQPATVIGPAGNFSITFVSATEASIVWPGGTVPIQRYDFGPGGAAGVQAAGTPQPGWWWAPTEGGRGYAIEIQGGSMFLAGYMYNAQGNPIWYASGPTAMSNAMTYQGVWQQYGFGQSLTGFFRPASIFNANVGNVTVQFSTTSTGTLTFPDGRQVPIARYGF